MASQKPTDYESWKRFHSYGNRGTKEKFDKIKCLLDWYEDARVARQNSCYWDRFTTNDKGTGSGGGDWAKRWSMQEKLWAMWFQPSNPDDFRSNVKSPMTTGRVESTLHKFRKVNMRWDARPNSPDDIGKEKVANILLDFLFSKANIREAMTTWVKDALIHGSAIARVYYQVQKRKYRFPVSGEDVANEKDKDKKEKYEKDLKDGKVVYGEPREEYKYDDIVVESIPLVEFYPDPQARTLHGRSYEARWVIRRRIMSIDDFKAEFENDPNAVDVDKVQATSVYQNQTDYMFFRPPQDMMDEKSVQVLEMEDQLCDEYCVLANDIMIKCSPLPWNHKEVTYHKLDCIEFIHQFYHIGIPDFLANIQGTQETLINLMIDYIFRSMNQQWMIDAAVYGEFTEAHMREDSQYIPVDTTDGKPLGSKIMPLQQAPINFDAFRINDILGDMATLSSQISPTQMALPDGGSEMPATLGVINKEQVELMLSSLIENFANGGLLTMGRQVWALMQQKYSVPDVKEVVGDKDKIAETKWRTIRLEGLKVVEDNDSLKFEDSPNDYDFFEIKDKYLNTSDELDIRIAPDSLVVMSKGLEMQKSREAYAQLMANAVDPNDSQMQAAMKSRGIVPLWDAYKVANWYAKANDIPDDIQLKEEEMTELEVKEAEEETLSMLRGESIPGQPGRGKAHIRYQVKILSEVVRQMNDLQMSIADQMQKTPPQMDPMTGEMIPPQPDAKSQDLMEQLDKVRDIISRHIAADNMPEDMFDESILEASSALIPPPPAPPQPQPGMQGPPGMPQQGQVGAMAQGGVPMVGTAPVPGGGIPMPQDPNAGVGGTMEGAVF